MVLCHSMNAGSAVGILTDSGDARTSDTSTCVARLTDVYHTLLFPGEGRGVYDTHP